RIWPGCRCGWRWRNGTGGYPNTRSRRALCPGWAGRPAWWASTTCRWSSLRPGAAKGGPGRRLLAQRVPGRAVHMVRDLALVPVPGARRAGWLEHQDRPARRRRLVLGAPGHHERVATAQFHDGDLAVRAAQGHVEPAVEDQEELVSVLVNVPDMLAPDVRHAHVVVVHPGHDARAVHLIEGR